MKFRKRPLPGSIASLLTLTHIVYIFFSIGLFSMAWAQEQKIITTVVEQKSFSGSNKVFICLRATEIIPFALPNVVDSFIIKIINLVKV